MKMKPSSHAKRFLAGIAMTVIVVALALPAAAQQKAADKKLAFGGALGLQTDTPDGTAFALGFYGDYFLTPEVSVGRLLQMGFTNDLRQGGLSAQAKYTLNVGGMPELKPHVQAGIGLIHADLDRPGRGSQSDTSYLIPFGVGAEYRLTDSVSLDTSFLFNINNLDLRDRERVFFTWLIGLKF